MLSFRLLIAFLLFSNVAFAATSQDPYDGTTKIDSQFGTEVTGGELRNINLDEGTTIEFDGNADYVTVTDDASLDLAQDMTIMGWVKADGSGHSDGKEIFSKHISSGAPYVAYGMGWTDANKFTLELGGDDNTLDTFTTNNAYSFGQWHHVAATYDGSNVNIYVDGVLDYTVAHTDTIDTAAGNLCIGTWCGRTNTNNDWDGWLDDLRAYSEALSADDIYALYSAGIEPDDTNLEMHHKFNDGSGTATDSSANSNTGTLTNAVWTTTHKPFYTKRGLTTSVDLVTASATSIDNFLYTTTKKSGGSHNRLQFSSDGSTWKNSNDDSVVNGGAYSFDGVNDEIEVTTDQALQPANLTFAYWVRRTSSMAGLIKAVFWGKAPSSFNTNGWYHLYDDRACCANQSVVTVVDGTPYFYVAADPDAFLPLNTWTHIAVTFNSSTNASAIYKNGVSQSVSTSGTPDSITSTTDLKTIAVNNGYDSSYWDGELDDIRIYSEVLSATEIYELYAQGKEPDDTNLEGWWKLDGDVTDSSSNGNDGTNNGATSVTNWYELQAFGDGDLEDTDTLNFDGSNDYVAITDNNVFSFGDSSDDDPFSISAWVNLKGSLGGSHAIVSKLQVGGTQEWALRVLTADQLAFALVDDGSGYIRKQPDFTEHFGKWTHVAGTYDGSSASSGIEVYINGVKQGISGDDSSYTAMHNTALDVNIGRDVNNNSHFKGQISNVAIWSDVRTQAEIITEYENGYVDLTDGNLVAAWHLNEGTGTAADNAEGTATYDGTISGATWIDDILRPVPAIPTQATIDVSGLSFTDAIYYRLFSTSNVAEGNNALTEVTADYTASASRRIFTTRWK